MTTRAQLRKAALAFPETTERAGSDEFTFTVRGTRFASVSSDKQVQLHLPAADAERVLTEHPTAERVSAGVRVPLADINGQQLNHWVRRAWLARAPQDLVARVSAGDTATAGQVGDLPKAIGNPATRALAGAGITTLAEAAKRSDAELLELHGVGLKAVRILREAQPGG